MTVAGVLLGGALAGCGGAAAPAPTALAPTSPSPASPSAPAPAAATSAAPKKPPTMAPGPAGRTPVFERRPTGGGAAIGAADKAAAEKVVALTFDADMTADQGPRAKAGERFDNPELIALLRRLKVPSTVFMTGRWAEEYPAQAKGIGTDDLFEVANHSYSHYAFTADCYGLPVVAEDAMSRDVERAFSAFRQAGVRNVVPYFRFPGGCYDDAALRALGPANVTAVQWDVVSGDAFATDAGAVAEQVLDGVRPGSLVVMHCTRSAAPVTAEAIGRIVPELRKRGYRFVKVSELMEG
ncbi:polysaccharide deacetylase family protein [Streptomyces arboris]|uniref:Polysaccharide deacetylase family protein n=1 Tax=Streptomyces arboris TaxID=2600619 RepID=A0A5N5EI75_9ACTN|nr:polysaccharide deacetylase family protein [Streptomyces arboris]